MNAKESLQNYCDWMTGNGGYERRLPDATGENARFSWYGVTYPLRTLIKASKILNDEAYARIAFSYMDLYVGEQLPQGGFTANYRRTPTPELTAAAHRDILRTGMVNLADNGSNVTCLLQAAAVAAPERRQRYLAAAKRWFEEWVPIWALSEEAGGNAFWSGTYAPRAENEAALKRGIYGNGIWEGHKINTPYTMAICNTATAFSAYYKATGDDYYRDEAEACARFLCKHWLADGRPINLSVYPMQRREVIDDYARIFYLMEGLCWAHSVAGASEVKSLVEQRLKQWLFSPEGVLRLWQGSWFDFNHGVNEPLTGCGEKGIGLRSSKLGVSPFWEMAKATAIPHVLIYYLNNIEDNPEVREKVELGIRFLCDPGKAKMAGIMSDPEETYGKYSLQATGFGGLSLIEAITPGTVFSC